MLVPFLVIEERSTGTFTYAMRKGNILLAEIGGIGDGGVIPRGKEDVGVICRCQIVDLAATVVVEGDDLSPQWIKHTFKI